MLGERLGWTGGHCPRQADRRLARRLAAAEAARPGSRPSGLARPAANPALPLPAVALWRRRLDDHSAAATFCKQSEQKRSRLRRLRLARALPLVESPPRSAGKIQAVLKSVANAQGHAASRAFATACWPRMLGQGSRGQASARITALPSGLQSDASNRFCAAGPAILHWRCEPCDTSGADDAPAIAIVRQCRVLAIIERESPCLRRHHDGIFVRCPSPWPCSGADGEFAARLRVLAHRWTCRRRSSDCLVWAAWFLSPRHLWRPWHFDLAAPPRLR